MHKLIALVIGGLLLVFIVQVTQSRDNRSPRPINQHDTLHAYHLAPIVLDLDGDGIELLTPKEARAVFHAYSEELVRPIGWVHHDDGILVRPSKVNPHRPMNGYPEEMLTSPEIDGFSMLSYQEAMDSSVVDGRIDAKDEVVFDGLMVWQDYSGNGLADDNELRPLSDYGITQLDIRAMPQKLESRWIDNNRIGFRSRFYRKDGTHGEMAYVLLQVQGESKTRHPLGERHVPDKDIHLPQHRGWGSLDSWQRTMDEDPVFRAMLEDFAGREGLEGVDTDMEAIILRWAGVENVAKDARGPYIDGRRLAAMERMFNEPFLSDRGESQPVHPKQGELLNQAWTVMLEKLRDRALVLGPLRKVFPNAEYRYDMDKTFLSAAYRSIHNRVCEQAEMQDARYAKSIESILLLHREELKVSEKKIREDIAACSI